MKLSSIAINGAAQTEGVWIDTIPNLPGLRLKVRADRNQDYRRLETKLIRELPTDRRANGLDPKDDDAIRARCLSETVLVDWEGIENDADEPIECTLAQRSALLAHPDYLVLLRAVEFAAVMAATQRRSDQERDAGN